MFDKDPKSFAMNSALKLVALTLTLSLAGAGLVRGAGITGSTETSGLRGKIGYCTDCHGVSGRGYYGYYTMPRLAGQKAEYLENQLKAFAEHRRSGGYAFRLSRVHAVPAAMRPALAEHFSRIKVSPLAGGQRSLVSAGRKIYQEGVPEANVPACVACHGPEALGSGASARLAGQLYKYTRKQLVNWSKDRIPDPAKADTLGVMKPIAQSLSKSQIDALASYLNSLK